MGRAHPDKAMIRAKGLLLREILLRSVLFLCALAIGMGLYGIILRPGEAALHAARAHALREMGNQDTAIRIHLAALRNNPYDSNSWMDFAETLAGHADTRTAADSAAALAARLNTPSAGSGTWHRAFSWGLCTGLLILGFITARRILGVLHPDAPQSQETTQSPQTPLICQILAPLKKARQDSRSAPLEKMAQFSILLLALLCLSYALWGGFCTFYPTRNDPVAVMQSDIAAFHATLGAEPPAFVPIQRQGAFWHTCLIVLMALALFNASLFGGRQERARIFIPCALGGGLLMGFIIILCAGFASLSWTGTNGWTGAGFGAFVVLDALSILPSRPSSFQIRLLETGLVGNMLLYAAALAPLGLALRTLWKGQVQGNEDDTAALFFAKGFLFVLAALLAVDILIPLTPHTAPWLWCTWLFLWCAYGASLLQMCPRPYESPRFLFASLKPETPANRA